jgi:anthranilate/para-aminobenzoate synthase component II
MILIINNYEDKKNVPKIIEYIESKNKKYKVVNSIEDIDKIRNVSGIILSGSPLMVNELDFIKNKEVFFKNVYAIYKFPRVPVLGICFGCQFLNVFWGGELQKLRKNVSTSLPVTFHPTTIFGKKIKSKTQDFKFNCIYAPKKIPNEFKEIAHFDVNSHKIPCIIKHKSLPIYGSLCHPEYLENTHWFIDDFLSICYK